MAKKGLIRNFIKDKIARSNPASILKGTKLWEDTMTYVVPAVTGYVVTRTTGRLVRNFIGPKVNYKWVKPLSLLGNVSALAGLWYLTSKVNALRKYKNGTIAGAGLATVQAIIELIMPKLAWIFDPATKQLSYSNEDASPGYPEEEIEDSSHGDGSLQGDDIDVVDGEAVEDYQDGIFSN